MRRLDRAGARREFPERVGRPARGRVGRRACCRGGRCGARPRRRTARHAQPEVVLAVPGAPPRADQGRAPAPAGQPRRRAGLAARRSRALPGSDGRGDVQILAGDFNATLDHRELRALLDRGYDDAADAAGEGLDLDLAGAAQAAPRAAADDRPRARRPPRARRARHGRADPAQRPPRGDRRAAPARPRTAAAHVEVRTPALGGGAGRRAALRAARGDGARRAARARRSRRRSGSS